MRWKARLRLRSSLLLALMGLASTSAHAQETRLGVFLATAQPVAPELAAQVDYALLSELSKSAGVHEPVVSPIDFEEIQLSLGCEGDQPECLSSAAETLQVEQLVVRYLRIDQSGRLVLRIVRFTPSSDREPTSAEGKVVPGSEATLSIEVRRLVRAVFGIPEPPTPTPSVPRVAVAAPVQVTPAPVPEAHANRSIEAPRDTSRGVAPLTWVLLASGTAVLATGIVFGVSARGSYNDFQNTPVDSAADARRAKDDFESLQTQGSVSNVLTPVGGAALGLGVVLLIFDLADGESSERPTARLKISRSLRGASMTLSATFGSR